MLFALMTCGRNPVGVPLLRLAPFAVGRRWSEQEHQLGDLPGGDLADADGRHLGRHVTRSASLKRAPHRPRRRGVMRLAMVRFRPGLPANRLPVLLPITSLPANMACRRRAHGGVVGVVRQEPARRPWPIGPRSGRRRRSVAMDMRPFLPLAARRCGPGPDRIQAGCEGVRGARALRRQPEPAARMKHQRRRMPSTDSAVRAWQRAGE